MRLTFTTLWWRLTVHQVVNYELGIVFPLYDEKDVERVSCFKRPARKYVSGQDRAWVSSFLRILEARMLTRDACFKIQEESKLLQQSQ